MAREAQPAVRLIYVLRTAPRTDNSLISPALLDVQRTKGHLERLGRGTWLSINQGSILVFKGLPRDHAGQHDPTITRVELTSKRDIEFFFDI